MTDDRCVHAVRPWWQGAVIYEIYVRSFQDGNDDGVGDLRGILKRLDYLVSLGIDAVWLTPFYPSPMVDGGYDVADYCDVDRVFGSLRDFDELVAALSGAGIRTIIDLVPNHTSERHPWFVDSRSSRTSRYRDWYVWRDPSPTGGPPNNWLSQPGGSAWAFDDASGQFYLHSFLPAQPDLNWRNPDVRDAFDGILAFWLDRGVSGFRVDVADRLLKDPGFRDDPPNPAHRPGDPDFMRLSPLNSSDQADLAEIAVRFRRTLSRYPGEPVLIGEIYQPVERLGRYYGTDLSGFDLPFNFNLMWLDWQARGVLDLIERYEAALPEGAWPTWVLGNHDQHRVASRLGLAQARVAMMLVLTLRGTPTLYQGDELGMMDGEVSPGRLVDSFGLADPSRGRDPFRTPMPWDATAYMGFSGVEAWLPVADADPRLAVSAQSSDDGSMLAMTRRCLRLRSREPALKVGAFEAISAEGDVLVYRRAYGRSTFIVALNFCSRDRIVRIPVEQAACVLSTHGPVEATVAGRDIDLRAHEGRVFRVLDPPNRTSDVRR
ncbi:alpha-amylase family glycosyl hydrolase [Alsobacter sp. R-9]